MHPRRAESREVIFALWRSGVEGASLHRQTALRWKQGLGHARDDGGGNNGRASRRTHRGRDRRRVGHRSGHLPGLRPRRRAGHRARHQSGGRQRDGRPDHGGRRQGVGDEARRDGPRKPARQRRPRSPGPATSRSWSTTRASIAAIRSPAIRPPWPRTGTTSCRSISTACSTSRTPSSTSCARPRGGSSTSARSSRSCM